MSTGKFQGVTAATTPIGSCVTMMRLAVERSCVEGSTWPAWRKTSSEARRKWSAVYSTISSRDSRMVLPTSRVIISAISSERSMQMVNAARQSSTRSRSETFRQVWKASAAAATASSTWAGVDAATVPSSSPVAGLVTSISSPSPGIHFPPMYASCRVAIAISPLLRTVSLQFRTPARPIEVASAEWYRRASPCRERAEMW